MIIALYAALAMGIQDVLGAMQSQSQARNKAALAGCLDMASWLAFICTTHYSLNAINGSDKILEYTVIAAVTAANFIGNYAGVLLGKKWIHAAEPWELQVSALRDELNDLKAQVAQLKVPA